MKREYNNDNKEECLEKQQQKQCNRASYSTDFLVMNKVKVKTPFLVKECTFVLYVAGEFPKCVSLL